MKHTGVEDNVISSELGTAQTLSWGRSRDEQMQEAWALACSRARGSMVQKDRHVLKHLVF